MYKVWWQSKDNNFGDLLTPYILKYFDIKYQQVDVKQNNLLMVGSIIRHANNESIILGSGMIKSKEKLNPYAKYKFVRGMYTRQKLLDMGAKCPDIYGDAGLIIDQIFPPQSKKHKIGIIPHFIDYNLVKNLYPDSFIINLKNDVEKIANEISSCEKIISSSLHGLIAAQSYKVPFAWVEFSKNLKGDGIKFHDFFSSVKLETSLSTIDNPKFMLGNYNNTQIISIIKSLSE